MQRLFGIGKPQIGYEPPGLEFAGMTSLTVIVGGQTLTEIIRQTDVRLVREFDAFQ